MRILLAALAAALALAPRSAQAAEQGSFQVAFGLSDIFEWPSKSEPKAAPSPFEGQAQILIVGLDVSASNRLIGTDADSRAYRAKAIERVRQAILGTAAGSADGNVPGLPPASIVLVGTFGDFSAPNAIVYDSGMILSDKRLEMAKQFQRAADEVAQRIDAMPRQAGKKGQRWTYIVGFLSEMAHAANAIKAKYESPEQLRRMAGFKGFRARVILLSDGVESTPGFELDELVAASVRYETQCAGGRSKRKDCRAQPDADVLPAPRERFQSCDSLEVLGLRINKAMKGVDPRQLTDRLADDWSAWNQRYGCAKFDSSRQF